VVCNGLLIVYIATCADGDGRPALAPRVGPYRWLPAGGRGEVPAAEAPARGEVHDDPRAAEEVPDETEAELEQVTESDSDDWEFVDS
jgi:hypothetical protein